MVEIEIDGKVLQAEPGAMIIEIADKEGISIPRFCYHKKLSVAANCRMCLVEVEKAPKPLPACATPITAGMKVFTQSAKAKEAQRAVMEFLLINHPLDCPICDQGGECELQDVSLMYGADASRFSEGKRSVKDDDLGSLIATEMTRCIQCTRCVRFGQEIAGLRELGATGRGENMQITTYVEHSMTSEMSGNIIDLCPVGALTSKPFRFRARAWELQQKSSLAPHDCIGSNIYLHNLGQKVMRAVPRENEAINETWLSDRDRFSYLAVQSEQRLQTPMIKTVEGWKEVSWEEAFEFVTTKLQVIREQYGAEQIGALASPSSTCEELYLLQKFMRGIGSNNIDHRLHQIDFTDQDLRPGIPVSHVLLEQFEQQDTILLLGSNIQREQPIASHRVRKATLRGAQVYSVNMSDYPFNFTQTEKIIVSPNDFVLSLAKILQALVRNSEAVKEVKILLRDVTPGIIENNIAEKLQEKNNKLIILGALAQNHPQASLIYSLARVIADVTGARLVCLTEGANSVGAWIAGAVPHRLPGGEVLEKNGLHVQAMLAKQLKAYILLNIEPEYDCANSHLALQAMGQADLVVALSPFKAKGFMYYADVILPISTFAENEGTYLNFEGRPQSFVAAVKPHGESRPAWKVLRVLGNQFLLENFNYDNTKQIYDEVFELGRSLVAKSAQLGQTLYWPQQLKLESYPITRITEWPIYAIDSVVRRSYALQEAATNEPVAAYFNEKLAAKINLKPDQGVVKVKQGETEGYLPVVISARIPDNCVLIHAGREDTLEFAETFGPIEIYAS